MVARGRRPSGGAVLLEILACCFVVTVIAFSCGALLRRQARDAEALYEEAVAWEAASAELERLEARAFSGAREGSAPLAVESPGWENLRDPAGLLVVEPAHGGRRITVRVTWTGPGGRPRRVEAVTFAGVGP